MSQVDNRGVNERFGYTGMANNAARYKALEDGKPLNVVEWQGRPLIHRDSVINGGVYMCGDENGKPLGEACVVDDVRQPELDKLYGEFIDKATKNAKRRGEHINQVLLTGALRFVQRVMPYNSDHADGIVEKFEPGTKVALADYLKVGGVCRHQALMVGYLLERCVNAGFLRGQVSVDRNYIPELGGGHSWVRYANSRGEIFIIDPAQDYSGRLDDSALEAGWDYRRPEDVAAVNSSANRRRPGGPLRIR